MAANTSNKLCSSDETERLQSADILGESMGVPTSKDPVAAFRLLPCGKLDWEKGVISFFHTLFEVVKVVPIRLEQPDQPIKEVILVLSSLKNAEVLEQKCFTVQDCRLEVQPIDPVEAEQTILKSKTKLYVGNIPVTADNSKIWRHFAKFGAVEYSCIVKKAERNLKGFGFVIFKDRESFEKALKTKHYIDGHRLVCKYFLNKTQQTRKCIDQKVSSPPESQLGPAPHHCQQQSRDHSQVLAETKSTQDETQRSDSSLESGPRAQAPASCSPHGFSVQYSVCSVESRPEEGLRFNPGGKAPYFFSSRVPI